MVNSSFDDFCHSRAELEVTIFAAEVYEKVDGHELCQVGTRSVTFAGIPSLDGLEDLPASG